MSNYSTSVFLHSKQEYPILLRLLLRLEVHCLLHFKVEYLVFGVHVLTPQCWQFQCIHCQQWTLSQENVYPSTRELRRNGHSPIKVVHLDAWRGACAPFCKFLEEVWGCVEKCFVVEEQVAQGWNEGPHPAVSMVAMADVSWCHEEKVSEEGGA